MTHPTAAFGSMLPGFDFMQGLVKNAGAALPGMNQWIAPTLDPEELDKRIQELKTVQFWLEQNARLLATSIQALEVQRMTLSTLKTMNVSLGDLAESLKARVPSAATAQAPAPVADSTPAANPFRLFMPQAPAAAEAPAAPEAAAPVSAPAAASTSAPASAPGASAAPDAAAPALVDPMQWWSALTQQFTELASKAVQDSAAAAAAQAAAAASAATSQTATTAVRKTTASAAKPAGAATAATQTAPRRAAPKRSAGPAR